MIQKKEKKMGYLFWLTVLAAIVLGGLTVYQAYDKVKSDNDAFEERETAKLERNRADQAREEAKYAQNKSEKYLNDLKNANEKIQIINEKSLLKADYIIKKNQEVINTQNDLKKANEKIQILNEQSLIKSDQIIKKNEEVIKAQTETIRSITGFGQPQALAGKTGDKDGNFFVMNMGDYNLKNLTVSIYDWTDGLKAHLKDNTFSNKILQKNLFETASITTLGPYQNLILSRKFDHSQFKAFEIRMVTDHSEFREFYISQHNNKDNKLRTRISWKLYEIDRLSSKWTLLQEIKNNNEDALFEKYFIMHSYMIRMD